MTPTNNRRLQVGHHTSRHVSSISSLGEEGTEGSWLFLLLALHAVSLVVVLWLEASIRLNPMLEAVELPTGVPDLHSRLSHVNRDDFALKWKDDRLSQLKSEHA